MQETGNACCQAVNVYEIHGGRDGNGYFSVALIYKD
jgi:hypothetical protein